MCSVLVATTCSQANASVAEEDLLLWVELNCLVIICKSCLQFALSFQQECPCIVRQRCLRVELDGLVEVFHCLGTIPKALVERAAVMIRSRVARVKENRGVVIRDGIVEALQPLIRVGPVIVGTAMPWVEFDSHGVVFDSLLELALY
jgi:hypothetical protein